MAAAVDQLQEAHAPEAFHAAVKGLHQGEVVRLKGGVAVKRKALEDGRDAYHVASPGLYGSGRGEPSFDSYSGDVKRTPEEAVVHAFRRSAESTDPDSIGGAERLTTYGSLEGGGRIRDWTTDGKAIVDMGVNGKVTRHPGSLRRAPLLASVAEEVMPAADEEAKKKRREERRRKQNAAQGRMANPALGEAYGSESRAAALKRRMELHPDWNWGQVKSAFLRNETHKSPVPLGHPVSGAADSGTRVRGGFHGFGEGRFKIKDDKGKVHYLAHGNTPWVTTTVKKRRGSLREEVGKPGTNWTQVGPDERKKINPIVKHYMKMAHPFAACVRDNTKRFGPERVKRVCAVVKDMGEERTTWRKGGKSHEEAAERYTLALLEAAEGDVEGLEILMLSYIAEQEIGALRGPEPQVEPFWLG